MKKIIEKSGIIFSFVFGIIIGGIVVGLIANYCVLNKKVNSNDEKIDMKNEMNYDDDNKIVTPEKDVNYVSELNWKSEYREIIKSISDTWDYGVDTKFDLIYLNDDNIPELVCGSSNISVLIYSYDYEKGHTFLLSTVTTGVRGATNISYVKNENVIIEQSGGMLSEMEYQEKEGCIAGFGSWGSVIKLDSGLSDNWSKMFYVFDENDNSKDVVEENISEEVQKYLDKAQYLDLKYNKEEISKLVHEI